MVLLQLSYNAHCQRLASWDEYQTNFSCSSPCNISLYEFYLEIKEFNESNYKKVFGGDQVTKTVKLDSIKVMGQINDFMWDPKYHYEFIYRDSFRTVYEIWNEFTPFNDRYQAHKYDEYGVYIRMDDYFSVVNNEVEGGLIDHSNIYEYDDSLKLINILTVSRLEPNCPHIVKSFKYSDEGLLKNYIHFFANAIDKTILDTVEVTTYQYDNSNRLKEIIVRKPNLDNLSDHVVFEYSEKNDTMELFYPMDNKKYYIVYDSLRRIDIVADLNWNYHREKDYIYDDVGNLIQINYVEYFPGDSILIRNEKYYDHGDYFFKEFLIPISKHFEFKHHINNLVEIDPKREHTYGVSELFYSPIDIVNNNYEPIDSKKLIDVFPNPFSSYLIFDDGQNETNFHVTLHSQNGNIVFESECLTGNCIMNFDQLISGIYFYKITSKDFVQVGKLIHQ